MIEVIDFERAALILSQRIDLRILHVLPDGEMVAYNELPDGTPVVELWRFRLVRR